MAFSDKLDPDSRWMQMAIDQAKRGVGLTSPNPPVGAVIVAQNRAIGLGYHAKAGRAHAEVMAIQDAKLNFPNLLSGATLYVTLEPCCTHGRTPPCTEAIIAAGIKRVVIGANDPNPLHHQKASEILMLKGVSVKHGTLAGECGELIRAFSKWITTGLPYVIAKAGQSLDGRITRPKGESQWLTSNAARIHGRRLRLRADAIIVGGETVRKDNPRLTLRDGCAATGKEQPWRVVLTRSGDIPADCHLLTDAYKDRTLIMKGENLREVMQQLGERGLVSVLIEGGGIVLGQAFREHLVDEVHWYISPLICGGGRPSVDSPVLAESVQLEEVKVMPMGDNVHMSGFVKKDWSAV